MRSDLVRKLQVALNSNGAQIQIDGLWGTETANAYYQFYNPLKEDILQDIRPPYITCEYGMLWDGNKLQPPFPCYIILDKPFNHRKRIKPIHQIILHHDACKTIQQALGLFQVAVSTHYLIDDQGRILQLLDPIRQVAFHVGRPLNDTSIGIDIHNPVKTKRDPRWQTYYRVQKGNQLIEGWGIYYCQQKATEHLVRYLISLLGWQEYTIGDGYGYKGITTDQVGIWGHGEVNQNKMPTEPHGFDWLALRENLNG